MTLLVALTNQSFSLLLADRRISHKGQVIDDEFNKLCVLLCDDARVSIAFTGLATLSGFNTSDWLVEELSNIGDTTGSIANILSELARRVSKRFSLLNTTEKRLSILISGFTYWTPTPQAIAYVLSNFEHGQLPESEFTLRTISPDNGIIVDFAGNSSALPDCTKDSLRSLLSSNLTPSSVLRSAVKHLRLSAQSNKSSNTIGEECNSAIIPSKVDTIVTTTYHSTFKSYVAYGSNVVITPGLSSMGCEIFADTVLAGPDIRRKDPCWCDSGKKFKNCHLKKFGEIYVKHSTFNKPLYSFFKMTIDKPRASGKVFVVASGYS
jgi:SEC-C motif